MAPAISSGSPRRSIGVLAWRSIRPPESQFRTRPETPRPAVAPSDNSSRSQSPRSSPSRGAMSVRVGPGATALTGSPGGVLEGGYPGQPDDAVLAPGVAPELGHADESRDGRHVDDRPDPVHHGGQFGPHTAPHAGQVYFEHPIPVFHLDLLYVDQRRDDARVVHGDIEPAVGVDSHLDHGGGVVGTWQTISPTRSDASDHTAGRRSPSPARGGSQSRSSPGTAPDYPYRQPLVSSPIPSIPTVTVSPSSRRTGGSR